MKHSKMSCFIILGIVFSFFQVSASNVETSLNSTTTQNTKDASYGKVKAVYYDIFSRGIINQSAYDEYLSQAYDHIYNTNSSLEKVYNQAISDAKSAEKLFSYRTEYYNKIIDIYTKAVENKLITQAQRNQLLEQAWTDITEANSNPEKVYKYAMMEYGNLTPQSNYTENKFIPIYKEKLKRYNTQQLIKVQTLAKKYENKFSTGSSNYLKIQAIMIAIEELLSPTDDTDVDALLGL